jgi:hypothetical protein
MEKKIIFIISMFIVIICIAISLFYHIRKINNVNKAVYQKTMQLDNKLAITQKGLAFLKEEIDSIKVDQKSEKNSKEHPVYVKKNHNIRMREYPRKTYTKQVPIFSITCQSDSRQVNSPLKQPENVSVVYKDLTENEIQNILNPKKENLKNDDPRLKPRPSRVGGPLASASATSHKEDPRLKPRLSHEEDPRLKPRLSHEEDPRLKPRLSRVEGALASASATSHEENPKKEYLLKKLYHKYVDDSQSEYLVLQQEPHQVKHCSKSEDAWPEIKFFHLKKTQESKSPISMKGSEISKKVPEINPSFHKESKSKSPSREPKTKSPSPSNKSKTKPPSNEVENYPEKKISEKECEKKNVSNNDVKSLSDTIFISSKKDPSGIHSNDKEYFELLDSLEADKFLDKPDINVKVAKNITKSISYLPSENSFSDIED